MTGKLWTFMIRGVRRAAVCVALGAVLSAAQTIADENNLDTVKTILEELIQRELDNGLPSLSLAMVRDSEVVWVEAYGYANVVMKVPATPQTLYNTASTLKPVTATAILTLVDNNLCNLDDPVNKYLGKSKINDPNDSVTIRHLLNHTSGLEGIDHNVSGGRTSRPWRRESVKSLHEIAASLRIGRPAGEEYKYNNSAYALAGLLVEKISGLSFEQYLVEHVLAPLGSTIAHPVHPSAEMVERMALPYGMDSKGKVFPVEVEQSAGYPAGDAYLTAEDMARVLGAHINNGSFNGEQLLSQGIVEMAHQPYLENYGLGWIIEKDKKGHRVIHHQGGVSGFTTFMIGDADTGEGVYVMTNASGFRSAVTVATAGFKLLRGDSYTLPKERIALDVEPAKLNSVLGKYANARTPGVHGPGIVTISLEGKKLLLSYGVNRQEYFDILSETTFYSKSLSMELRFEKNNAEWANSLRLIGDDYDLHALRVNDDFDWKNCEQVPAVSDDNQAEIASAWSNCVAKNLKK